MTINGQKAADAFQFALKQNQKFDWMCRDALMSEVDGRRAVNKFRAME